MHIVRIRQLGVPQKSRDAFSMLQQAGILDNNLANRMQAMVGFRNIAVHNYQVPDWVILRSILNERLEDFKRFAQCLIKMNDAEKKNYKPIHKIQQKITIPLINPV